MKLTISAALLLVLAHFHFQTFCSEENVSLSQVVWGDKPGEGVNKVSAEAPATAPSTTLALVDTPAEEVAIEVQIFNQINVDSFVNTLKAAGRTRSVCHAAIGAAVAAGSTYVLYQAGKGLHEWWKAESELSQEKKKSLKDQIDNQRERIDVLKGHVANLDARLKQQLDDAKPKTRWGRIWDWAKQKGNGFGGFLLGVPFSLAYMIAQYELQGATIRAMPWKVGEYILGGRTLEWCIKNKTKLVVSFNNLVDWADGFEARQGEPSAQEFADLALTMNSFIREVEKVVGYMKYVANQLTDDQALEKRRAAVSMGIIEKECNKFAKAINTIVTQHIALNRAEFAAFIKGGMAPNGKLLVESGLFSIISQMKKFESVQEAVGYESVDDYKIFKTMETYLDPEARSLKRQVDLMHAQNEVLKEQMSTIAPVIEKMTQQIVREAMIEAKAN